MPLQFNVITGGRWLPFDGQAVLNGCTLPFCRESQQRSLQRRKKAVSLPPPDVIPVTEKQE